MSTCSFDTEESDFRLFGIANAYGDAEMVKQLIAAGCNVNARRSCDSMTPLHFAAKDRRMEIVPLLLAAGADKSARNSKGLTASDIATEQAEHWEKTFPDSALGRNVARRARKIAKLCRSLKNEATDDDDRKEIGG